MKAVVSTTYDHAYLFFLPIITWCWNKLGVDVVCFAPHCDFMGEGATNQVPAQLMRDSLVKYNLRCELHYFIAPKHKQPTYAQCARLYAGSIKSIEGCEVLVTSDIDMAVFSFPFVVPVVKYLDIYGNDLVPDGQLPMCYAVGFAETWRDFFSKERTLQQCLDDELAHEECENMRGNLWSRDQELLFKYTASRYVGHPRAKPGTQFASNRIDRDDSFWRDRLNADVFDAHLWRPGYTDENFANILELLRYFYPHEDFQWLIDYRNEYIKLL